jgi:hypothetical protein
MLRSLNSFHLFLKLFSARISTFEEIVSLGGILGRFDPKQVLGILILKCGLFMGFFFKFGLATLISLPIHHSIYTKERTNSRTVGTIGIYAASF